MAIKNIGSPYNLFYNLAGTALENGKIYIGLPNLDPETNPKNVYFDSDLTIPAAQPVRTTNGYISESGAPRDLYVSGEYSITVRDKNDGLVYTKLIGDESVNDLIFLSDYDTLSEALTAISTNDVTLVVNNAYTVNESVTIPSNVALLFYKSGSLTVGGTFTITYNSPGVRADIDNHIFRGAGTHTGTLYVTEIFPEWFGALGDGSTDDVSAINNAIDFLTGGDVVFTPGRRYAIGSKIELQRGIRLIGRGTNDTQNNSSEIFLLANSNSKMIETEYARTALQTHYYALENLLIDGNGDNQTTEVVAVDFQGVFVMSWIKNVFIRNTRGTSLLLENGLDVDVNHLWIINPIISSSSNYALEINPNLTSGLDGLPTFHHLYVENIRTAVGDDPRNNEAERGNAILCNRVVKGSFTGLHIEGADNAVDVGFSHALVFNGVSGSSLGNSANSFTGYFRFLDASTNAIVINAVNVANFSSGYKILLLDNGVSSNDIREIDGVAYLSSYVYADRTDAAVFSANNPIITNTLTIRRVNAFSEQSITIQSNTANLDDNHYIKSSGNDLTLGSNYDQTTSNDFITINSFGNNGDNVTLGEPLVLASRTSANNVGVKSLYAKTAGSDERLIFISQTNEETDVPIVLTGTSAPSTTPYTIGLFFVDSAAGVGYISTGTASSADWKQITP